MIELTPSLLAAAAGGTGTYTAALAAGLVIDPSLSKLIETAIGASVTIVMGWIAYRTLNRKLDDVSRKTAVIEGHVNSERTQAQGDIAALQQEVRILRETLSDKKETAALLAASAAQGKKPDKESGR